MTSLVFPETTDRILPSVADSAERGSSATVGCDCPCTSESSDKTLTPAQRESAIDKAQRRARVHKDAYNAALEDYLKTQRPVFLHVAEIHKVLGECAAKQAEELIQGRG